MHKRNVNQLKDEGLTEKLKANIFKEEEINQLPNDLADLQELK